MYSRERRVLLRHYLEQGVGKTELARRFGVSRRTVYHWIETAQLDREVDDAAVIYKPRPRVSRKLDRYRGIIQARLQLYPRLTAQRLFEEIRSDGYAGGYTQIKDYVREIRPRDLDDAVQRFETPAGFQGQVDFASFNLPWGRRYALIVVLGYSRLLWLKFFARQSMQILFAGLESAFNAFGGVPQELLFDQMRAVVIGDERFCDGALVLNGEFLRFAAHWGFRPRACRPYRAKTKGKVERPIRYLRESFFYGRTFINDADLNAQAEYWVQQTANLRRHRTIEESPQRRFERDERQTLKSLAPAPYPRLHAVAPSPPAKRTGSAIEVQRRSLSVYADAIR
ncbi:MAG: IS21 family transposase [Steroidobacteraceae bacterium]